MKLAAQKASRRIVLFEHLTGRAPTPEDMRETEDLLRRCAARMLAMAMKRKAGRNRRFLSKQRKMQKPASLPVEEAQNCASSTSPF
jgi:hypothetical protein